MSKILVGLLVPNSHELVAGATNILGEVLRKATKKVIRDGSLTVIEAEESRLPNEQAAELLNERSDISFAAWIVPLAQVEGEETIFMIVVSLLRRNELLIEVSTPVLRLTPAIYKEKGIISDVYSLLTGGAVSQNEAIALAYRIALGRMLQ